MADRGQIDGIGPLDDARTWCDALQLPQAVARQQPGAPGFKSSPEHILKLGLTDAEQLDISDLLRRSASERSP